MKLLAISDIHLGFADNLAAIRALPEHPDDWLILGGDIGETADDLRHAIDALSGKFARLVWIPGNHDLWTLGPAAGDVARGEAKYHQLVQLCRAHDVLTPEDPYVIWRGEGGPHIIAPLLLLYDYTFRPAEIPDTASALAWAAESGIVCADEERLHPDPYPTREAWCHARCEASASRLEAARREHAVPTILINHFPLHPDDAVLPAIPRFSIWCGTTATRDWHRRFGASVVVYGHLHLRTSFVRDGVRFEEVSLGYPRHWRRERGAQAYLRQILPHPTPASA